MILTIVILSVLYLLTTCTTAARLSC